MYRFQVISNGYIIFSTNEFNSFIDLVNNTKFNFDYIDSKGYEIILYYNNKIVNITQIIIIAPNSLKNNVL